MCHGSGWGLVGVHILPLYLDPYDDHTYTYQIYIYHTLSEWLHFPLTWVIIEIEVEGSFKYRDRAWGHRSTVNCLLPGTVKVVPQKRTAIRLHIVQPIHMKYACSSRQYLKKIS